MNNAKNVISDIIEEKGPITFKEFMELALYHPQFGYYSTKEIEEDYITSSSFELFAKGLLVAFRDMLEKCGGDTIVEFGAGDGKLAEQISRKLNVNYIIVEKSQHMKEAAQQRLEGFENVNFMDEPELENLQINGVVFTNEFFDALPVNVVVKDKNGELKEVYVDHRDDKFVELIQELSNPEIEDYFARLDIELEEGARAEVNLDAIHYIERFSRILKEGFVLTIDYGFPSEELYTLERSDGTVACYTDHTYNFNPYIKVGEQDITSHVNFSALMEYGNESGLDLTGLTNHLYFLMSTLGENEVDDFETADEFKFLAFRMGSFKVLIQHKGMERPYLVCLQMTPSFGYWNRYNYQGQLEMEFLEE
ncbi:MAG: class I SAM-dependent methyltransferase [Archaeoglobaceae archaeon]